MELWQTYYASNWWHWEESDQNCVDKVLPEK